MARTIPSKRTKQRRIPAEHLDMAGIAEAHPALRKDFRRADYELWSSHPGARKIRRMLRRRAQARELFKKQDAAWSKAFDRYFEKDLLWMKGKRSIKPAEPALPLGGSWYKARQQNAKKPPRDPGLIPYFREPLKGFSQLLPRRESILDRPHGPMHMGKSTFGPGLGDFPRNPEPVDWIFKIMREEVPGEKLEIIPLKVRKPQEGMPKWDFKWPVWGALEQEPDEAMSRPDVKAKVDEVLKRYVDQPNTAETRALIRRDLDLVLQDMLHDPEKK